MNNLSTTTAASQKYFFVYLLSSLQCAIYLLSLSVCALVIYIHEIIDSEDIVKEVKDSLPSPHLTLKNWSI